MVSRRRGYTLVELMITSAIVALLASLGASLLMKINVFFSQSMAKIETQRDLRNIMDLMTREIRQGKSSTVVLSRNDASQPPYSKITYQKVSGETISFWQSGRSFFMGKSGQSTLMTNNLRSLIFSYPSTDNSSLITVQLSMEKPGGSRGNYGLQMGGETVRILNE
jgi:prepilin-type N-terminal cleavage/methylation domain-containing protein